MYIRRLLEAAQPDRMQLEDLLKPIFEHRNYLSAPVNCNVMVLLVLRSERHSLPPTDYNLLHRGEYLTAIYEPKEEFVMNNSTCVAVATSQRNISVIHISCYHRALQHISCLREHLGMKKQQ